MLMPAFLLLLVALSQPGTYHMQKSKLTVEQYIGGWRLKSPSLGLLQDEQNNVIWIHPPFSGSKKVWSLGFCLRHKPV